MADLVNVDVEVEEIVGWMVRVVLALELVLVLDLVLELELMLELELADEVVELPQSAHISVVEDEDVNVSAGA